jgi:methionine-rich copper-binding protein CopC
MKNILVIVAAIAVGLSSTPQAHAHAQVSTSVPLKNKTIKVLPRLVWVEFDSDLITLDGKASNAITVTNAKKKRVDDGSTIIGGARISTYLKAKLPAGRYLVSYRVVSEDGHPVIGSYYFTYQP